jgi:hypothetical protein
LWGEKAQLNERNEWNEERKKKGNMVLRPIQITKITSFLAKAQNWKSSGND